MTPIPAAIITPEALEQAWLKDKEEHCRLEAELRKLEMQREVPDYDSRLRHDARFPDSTTEDVGGSTRNDRLSLDGDEPPVR